MVEALLDLQAAAGNHTVAAALGKATVQRQPAPPGKNDGGALLLEAEEAFPLQSATWSLRVGIQPERVGRGRITQLQPGNRDVGELVLKRSRDAQSTRLQQVFGKVYRRGSLRLDRPSRDGALPATSLLLEDVTVAGYSLGRGDVPSDTLTLSVGDLHVAGVGKEASEADAVAYLKIGDGPGAWPPLPVIAVERSGRLTNARLAGYGDAPSLDEPEPQQHFKVKLGAGMGVTRLAEALDKTTRLNLTISHRRGGSYWMLSDALVVKIASSADGPSVVEVEFVAEAAQLSAGQKDARRTGR